ncbi:MAG: hypothetical protein COX57_08365 [Alphaproteobacteria bacterium CG_4_10_14_0_2_um_filter_63_37]|nr:MAG: hypothetical protein AUJ55_07570 [Proteobacteria bacterium CG1_02_64_396]PJA24464.1 MAG: hypothetical protein COX57_08365 [Alphaproteobacteria bacterium CG_4_10_14_0_2_um_filter_63_37]
MNVLIVGAGYFGGFLARELVEQGHRVFGIARHQKPDQPEMWSGWWSMMAEEIGIDHPAWRDIDALVYTIAPPVDLEPDPRLLRILQIAARHDVTRISYVSSTGVLGDHGGRWIDESTPTQPQHPMARRRLAAEALALAWGGQIWRMSGIVGPGRNLEERLLAGKIEVLIDWRPARWFNRIEVRDAARLGVRLLDLAPAGSVVHFSDGAPYLRRYAVAQAARRLGLSPPRLIDADQAEQHCSPIALALQSGSKRLIRSPWWNAIPP